jgi:hypothetical protein
MGIRETRDPGTGQPVIPEFRATGVDGITMLAFEPDAWPPRPGNAMATRMRVIHKISGIGRDVEVTDLPRLADWFADGMREFEIRGERSVATLEWSGGYVQVHVWQNADGRSHRYIRGRKTWLTTVDPWTVRRISQFLAGLRRTGWTHWNAQQGT